MNSISIFTPTNNPIYLPRAYKELKNQCFDEWIILANGGLSINDFSEQMISDSRIKIIFTDITGSVGALKKIACSYCSCDILLELDHDDILTNNAIEKVKEAFLDPEICFVYSNCAKFMDKQYWFPNMDPNCNWVSEEFIYNDEKYISNKSPSSHPTNQSTIHYCADHVRAFRKSVYDYVGGHDSSLEILDDQDLICKMYTAGKFYHIDECLYLYYIDLNNTWIKRQKDIDEHLLDGRRKYMSSMVETWAQIENLKMIALTSESFPEYYNKMTTDDFMHSNIEENSIGVITVFNNFVNSSKKEEFISKAYKSLIPGGFLLGLLPYSKDGWNEDSFSFTTNKNHPSFSNIRFFQCLNEEFIPTEYHKDFSYLKFCFCALKKDKYGNEIFRPHGIIKV